MSFKLALAACLVFCALAAPAGAQAVNLQYESGSVVALNGTTITIQTGGRATGVIKALTDAANAITAKDYPYVWGGGHAEAGVASVGERGPGYNGKRIGFDCSGAVTAVLAGAGLWTPGSGVPADNGVIAELEANHLIARGVGTAPNEVTLYDDPGVHIFMNIDGRFFGTSDGGGGGDKKGGPGWLDDGAWDATDPSFKKYHLLPSVLRTSTTYGNDYTFVVGPYFSEVGLEVGEGIRIGYVEQRSGELAARTITFSGQRTLSGAVTAISGTTLTLATSSGSTNVSVGDFSGLLNGVAVGDTVTVTASELKGVLTAHSITVTATPPGSTTSTTTTTTSQPDGGTGVGYGGSSQSGGQVYSGSASADNGGRSGGPGGWSGKN